LRIGRVEVGAIASPVIEAGTVSASSDGLMRAPAGVVLARRGPHVPCGSLGRVAREVQR
jgi:hypothetical protein